MQLKILASHVPCREPDSLEDKEEMGSALQLTEGHREQTQPATGLSQKRRGKDRPGRRGRGFQRLS